MDFGALLKKLRSDRGLNQEQLAKLAKVTVFTISRGERSKTVPWKRSNSLAVMRALAHEAPLTRNEEELYLQFTGMQALARMSETPASTAKGTAAARRDVAAASVSYSTHEEPDHTTVHTWVQAILEDVPAAKLLTAIEGLAAAWGIDLPPRLTKRDADAHGAWVHHSGPIDTGDGRTIEIHTPVQPSPAKPKAQPKRKSAS